ncbi:MAG: acyl-CoA thioesterase-1, partial [Planctomycetota bacterium]
KNSSPDLVVIEVGANDALRGQPLKEVEANLREIISTIHLTDAQVLLLGMDAPTNLGDYARKFAEIYTRVSAEHDVLLVPSFLDGVGGIPDMNLPDGLHPTPEGHERLAKNIVRPLASLLSTASPRIAPAAATPQGR